LERRCWWSGIPDGGPQTPLDILATARVTERVLRADQGSSDPNLAEGGQTLSAVYSKPLIGHGSIGPSCGIATVSDSGVARFKNTGSYCRGRGVRFGGGDRRGAQAVGSGGRGSCDQTARAESWRDYPILSFAETPETNVEIVAAPEFPSTGVGEVSLGPTAGAIANAVANALGLRVRDPPTYGEND
jgi:hypothetical protein